MLFHDLQNLVDFKGARFVAISEQSLNFTQQYRDSILAMLCDQ